MYSFYEMWYTEILKEAITGYRAIMSINMHRVKLG